MSTEVITHTEMDNFSFDTMPKPAKIQPRPRRMPSRFELWAWSPVVSFQIGLTASYLGMIYFGVSAYLANPPVFDLTAPDGWATAWSIALMLGGALGAIGSINRKLWFERLELLGSSLGSLTIGSYACILLFLAYAQDDASRAAVGAGMVALMAPILVRAFWLASQTLRK